MPTIKQIEANKRNATRSTGPTTSEGKRTAALSATRHGLCASGSVLVPGEDPEEFRAFVERMITEIDPQTELESRLAERLVGLAWRLRRAPVVEAQILKWFYHDEVCARANTEADWYVEEDEEGFEEPVVTQPRLRSQALKRAGQAVQARDDGTILARAFQKAGGSKDPLALLERYERSLERSFSRCLHELQRLQASRSGREVPLPVAVDVNLDVPPENGFVR